MIYIQKWRVKQDRQGENSDYGHQAVIGGTSRPRSQEKRFDLSVGERHGSQDSADLLRVCVCVLRQASEGGIQKVPNWDMIYCFAWEKVYLEIFGCKV